jgi:shikimate kinase
MTGFTDRIYLTGFMAAGKSTVGRLLAGYLGYRFVDLDTRVERRAGRTVRQIFEDDGEGTFRQLEADALAALASESRIVVSTGGGALASAGAMDHARAAGLVVFLDVPEELLVERILRNERRPLINHIRSQGRDAVAAFVHELLTSRRNVYEQAHVTVDTGRESPESITREILEALRQLSRNDRR